MHDPKVDRKNPAYGYPIRIISNLLRVDPPVPPVPGKNMLAHFRADLSLACGTPAPTTGQKRVYIIRTTRRRAVSRRRPAPS